MELIYEETLSDSVCKEAAVELWKTGVPPQEKIMTPYLIAWEQVDSDGEFKCGFSALEGHTKFEAIRAAIELLNSIKAEIGL